MKSVMKCFALLLGSLAAATPQVGTATYLLNEKSTWPVAPAVQTTNDPASILNARGTAARGLVQTFQLETAIQLDKIFLGYSAGVIGETFDFRLFTVPDVNATPANFMTPDNPSYSGTVLLTETVTLTENVSTVGGVSAPTIVMEFDLTGSSEIMLAATSDTAGYAFQIVDEGAHALAWKITTSGQGNIYPNGKFIETETLNDFGGRDSVFAIAAVSDDPIPGDFNDDGKVDGADFSVWQMSFPIGGGATIAVGDGDGDGDVDGADFVVWQTNFPYPSATAIPVPEPQSIMLLMAGVAMLVACRVKRKC